MSISIIRVDPLITEVTFTKYALTVVLADGRKLSVPLEWLPGLRDATDRQRRDWRLIAHGVGIHWNELDEDVLVEDLLAFSSPAPREARWVPSLQTILRKPGRASKSRR